MISNVLTIERRKLFGGKILWVELGILALLIVGLDAFSYFVAMVQQANGAPDLGRTTLESAMWPHGFTQGLAMTAGNFIGGMLIITLIGALTAQEYSTRTLQLWLSQGTSRLTLYLGKFAMFLVPVVLISIVAAIVSAIASVGITVVDGSPLAGLDLAHISMSWLRTAYSLLPYAGLAFLLATLTRSATITIAFGLAYVMLLEPVLAQLLPRAGETFAHLAMWLPAALTNTIMQLNQSPVTVIINGEPAQPAMVDPLQATIGIAAYTIVFVGLALVAFRRQDLAN